VAICHPATAQVAARWQFADTNGTLIAGTPSIPVGNTITWRVYLTDLAGASAPFLNKSVNGTVGLAGAAATVSSSNAAIISVNSTPAPPGGNNPTTPNAAGTQWAALNGLISNSGSTSNSINLNAGLLGGSVPADATGRIFLGTYTFSALSGGSASLTVNTRPGFTVYAGDNSVLDPSLGSSTQGLTITAVPEPGSMLLCGLGAVGLAAYRRRARKTAVVVEEAAA